MDGERCTDTGAVTRLFRALASPVRVLLVDRLNDGPLTVGQLVTVTHQKQANVSKHLGILYTAKLVRSERRGNRVVYSLFDHTVPTLLRRAAALGRRRG